MRRPLSVAVLAAGMLATSAAQAVIVTTTCGTIQTFANASGSATVTCPSVGTATGVSGGSLYTLNNVALSYIADYTFGTAPANNIEFTFTVSAPAGVTWENTTRTIYVAGTFSPTTFVPPVPVFNNATAGETFANFASTFDVGIVSTPVSGRAASSSALVQISYDYVQTPSPPTDVPTPATAALLGMGLLAGWAGRRARRV